MESEQKNVELRSKLGEIREKALNNGLFINRVPKKTKEQFIAWAAEEFDGDWGFTLQYLLQQSKEYQEMKKLLFAGKLLSARVNDNDTK